MTLCPVVKEKCSGKSGPVSLQDIQGHFQGSPIVPVLPSSRKHVISKISGGPFGTEYEFSL